MKKIYTLMAIFATMASISVTAHAADASDAANLSVLWDEVTVTRTVTSADVVVTAQIRVADGKTFSGKVFPVLHSTSLNIDYGEGTPQMVTLPTSTGSNETAVMTWKFTALSAWGRDSSRTMYCIMKFEDDLGKDVEIGRAEVLRDGTTGVSDAVANPENLTEVYDISGVQVARGDNVDLQSLTPGVYIVRNGSQVSKIIR